MAMPPAPTVVAKMAPNAMNAPARMLSTNSVIGSVATRLTPPASARSAMVAGKIASKVTGVAGAAGCGDFASVTPDRSCMSIPPRFCHAGVAALSSAARCQEADDLHRDDFHDGHRWKDHRIAYVRPFGRRHAGGIDQDGGIAGRTRGDADEIVVGNLEQIISNQQDNDHR